MNYLRDRVNREPHEINERVFRESIFAYLLSFRG
jgi:hypothetical protein